MRIETTPWRRAGFTASCACLLAAVALSASGAPSAGAAGCPNEGVRQQQGATYLPACRAYEMVSPQDKAGYDVGLPISSAASENTSFITGGIDFTAADAQAAPDGDKVTFKSIGGFAGIQSSTAGTNTYIAERGPAGWTTKGASLPFLKESPGLSLTTYPIPYTFTESLSAQAAIAPEAQRLSPRERLHDMNVYTRDNLTGALTLRTPEYLPGSEYPRIVSGYGAASADLSHITFFSSTDVLPDVPPGRSRAYESYLGADGETHVRLVSILPNGELAPEASSVGGVYEAAANRADDLSENSISRDGSRIVWFESDELMYERCRTPEPLSFLSIQSYGCPTRVFLREDGTTTRDVAAPAPGTPVDPSPGPGELFMAATPDVGSVFFTAQRNLTPDANADDDGNFETGSYGDLYRYRPEGDGGAGELVDVTPDPVSPAGAQVLGVLAVSESGDRVYFVARSNRLDGERGVQGEANLYLWSDVGGTPRTTFVATLAAPTESAIGDARDWLRSYQREAMTTPSGGDLVFSSRLPAAGVDTAGTKQVYRYDAASDTVTCVSCPGNGDVPSADAELPGPARVPFIDHHPRAMTTDGSRVFFETAESLSPLDGNGVIDVYEWNAETGAVAMLSDGSGADPSFLEDVTPDGSDVFIATRAALVGADVDRNVDLYDVRVGGGFAEAPPAAECVGGACKEPREAAPGSAALGSTTLAGVPKPTHRAGCAKSRRQATKLDRQAKRLRKKAKRGGGSQAAAKRRKAGRLEAQSKGLKAKAKRCESTMQEVAR